VANVFPLVQVVFPMQTRILFLSSKQSSRPASPNSGLFKSRQLTGKNLIDRELFFAQVKNVNTVMKLEI